MILGPPSQLNPVKENLISIWKLDLTTSNLWKIYNILGKSLGNELDTEALEWKRFINLKPDVQKPESLQQNLRGEILPLSWHFSVGFNYQR